MAITLEPFSVADTLPPAQNPQEAYDRACLTESAGKDADGAISKALGATTTTDVIVVVPLSIAVLVASALTFVIGGLVVWLAEMPRRARARQAEHAVKLLEDEVKALKARLGSDGVLPPRA